MGEEGGRGGDGGGLEGEHPLRPPPGIKLAQATGESIWWQSELDGAHIQRCT